MEIVRFGSDKSIAKTVERIEVVVDGVKYTIKERFGKINIHSHDDSISVSPCSANVIDVK